MDESASILVLEDDDEMRAMLTYVLEDQGYNVVAVERGHDAVVKVAEQPFDLIVADIRMDGIDGLEVVERSRQQQPSIGTLVVSGYASEAETARARTMRVGGFLKKPFRMAHFLELVREQLRGKQVEEASRQRGTSQRVVLTWALESLIKIADETGMAAPSGTLARIGSVAAAVARSLQLSDQVCLELRLGSMLTALESVPVARPPRSFLDDAELMPALSACFHEGTTESSIAKLSRLAGSNEELPSAEEMSRKHSGELDTELLDLYERARLTIHEPTPGAAPEVVSGLWDPGRKARSLLALGKALERAGDLQSAVRAYGQVIKSCPTGRQAVQAMLRQAEVSLTGGENEEAAEYARAASRRAVGLGPSPRALTLLESGVLLARLKADEANEILKQAAEQLKVLGLDVAAARATAALGSDLVSQEDLTESFEVLLQPNNASEFLASTVWLTPILVDKAAQLGNNSWLSRLVIAYPRELTSALTQGLISREGRESLITFIESEKPSLTEELREALAREADPALRGRVAALEAGDSQGTPPSYLRVTTFGYFELHRGSDLIDDKQWKTQKTKYLFAFLASRWGTSFTEDKILDEFWPDDREKGKKNLYWSTSVARRCLRGPDGNGEEILLRERGQLTLKPELAHWQDLEEFQRSFEEGQKAAKEGKATEALAALRRLAGLYQGPYLEGCYMDWAVRMRGKLERQAAEGLCMAAELLLNVEENQEALESARQAVEIQPHRQEGHLLIMRALIGLGRPEEAITQFRKCESYLRREYDIEPITELIEYYHRARLGM